eukprot:12734836-Alexandrium_andersonii.AAC.1
MPSPQPPSPSLSQAARAPAPRPRRPTSAGHGDGNRLGLAEPWQPHINNKRPAWPGPARVGGASGR